MRYDGRLLMNVLLQSRALRAVFFTAVPLALVVFLWSFITELAGMIAAAMVIMLWHLLVWLAETVVGAILVYGVFSAWRDRRRIASGIEQVKLLFGDEYSRETDTLHVHYRKCVRSTCK